jgi:hypothetical protein
MPTAWYTCSLVPSPIGPQPSLISDLNLRFRDEILADGGFMAETTVRWNTRLCKVRASARVQAQLRLAFPEVSDPSAEWVATRTAAKIVDGVVVENTRRAFPCTPWQWKDRECLGDAQLDAYKLRRDSFLALADKEGYVRFAPQDQFDKYTLLRMFGDAGYGLNRLSTGTFPTNTTALDDCARADEDPLSNGGIWTGPIFPAYGGALRLVSNSIRSSGAGDDSSYINTTTYGPRSEAWLVIGGTSNGYGPHVRIAAPNTAGVDAYGALYNVASTIRIYEWNDQTPTPIFTGVAYTAATGDGIGCEADGSTIASYKRVSGTWSLVESGTDTTISAAGYIGCMRQNDATGSFTAFYGGTITDSLDPAIVPVWTLPPMTRAGKPRVVASGSVRRGQHIVG